MPIRIREVHIKATVADEESVSKKVQEAAPSGNMDIQHIVGICVAQVMRRIKKIEDR